MFGLTDDGLSVCYFDDFAEIHDHDSVAKVFNYGQVMGDKKKSDTALLLQVLQKVDDLGLNGNVQGANRLITNKQFGFNGQSARDANALALTAAEFVRIALRVGRVESNSPEQFGDSRLPGRIVLCQAMNVESFTDNVFDGHPRVERAIGILKDHLQHSSMPAQVRAVQSGYVTVSKPDFPGGRSDESNNRTSKRRLTATTFAHEAESFT
jgi:hypothetical protein